MPVPAKPLTPHKVNESDLPGSLLKQRRMKIKLLQQILRLHFYGSHFTFSGQTATRNVSPQDQTSYVRLTHTSIFLRANTQDGTAPAPRGQGCRQQSLGSFGWAVPSPGRRQHCSGTAGARPDEENPAFLLSVPAHVTAVLLLQLVY